MPDTRIKEYADSDGSYGLVRTQQAEFEGIQLESGIFLGPLTVAYETYGELSPDKDNVVLILHALSGDAHVAGVNEKGRIGWWDALVGPGKGIDTNKYFVVCSNCLGGCKGTTGPRSINPLTGKPYGRSFPLITMGDMVNVQYLLMRHLGIERLHNVIGGSMGGMQALEWVIRYPDFVESAIVIAATARLSPQGIAFNWVGRNAIYSDPAKPLGEGDAAGGSQKMGRGLAVARMIGHITYLSEDTMEAKFGRKRSFKDVDGYRYTLGENGKEGGEFEVESYLEHQGSAFMERFDEDSYVIITKAIDRFDLEAAHGDLVSAFKNIKAKILVISYTSDWLYPTSMSLAIVRALQATNKHVSFVELDLPYGHDSFLVNDGMPSLTRIVRGFLSNVSR
ncbi:MAG: homoserine O-acetyltransferase MetX [Desulfomonilaceae bacterium]